MIPAAEKEEQEEKILSFLDHWNNEITKIHTGDIKDLNHFFLTLTFRTIDLIKAEADINRTMQMLALYADSNIQRFDGILVKSRFSDFSHCHILFCSQGSEQDHWDEYVKMTRYFSLSDYTLFTSTIHKKFINKKEISAAETLSTEDYQIWLKNLEESSKKNPAWKLDFIDDPLDSLIVMKYIKNHQVKHPGANLYALEGFQDENLNAEIITVSGFSSRRSARRFLAKELINQAVMTKNQQIPWEDLKWRKFLGPLRSSYSY